MDRVREGRRSSVGGSASAPRRPRTTGLKDSSGMDDDSAMDISYNSRQREKTRKEKESSGVSTFVYSVNSLCNSRNKRRRQEASVHPRNTTEDRGETSEETETGVSEDDDDVPPPMSRRPGKPKFQGKHANDGSAVDISVVPRKARTAMSKRPLESPSPPVAAKQPLHSSTSPSAATHSVLSLSRSARRMKSCSPKPRAPKLTKVSTSTSISEQEVEIAEALFDLARMVPSQTSPSASESKIDLVVEAKPESNVVLPVTPPASTSVLSIPGANHTGSPASPLPGPTYAVPNLAYASRSTPAGSTSSVQVAGSSAEIAKRKRPRVKRTDDAGSIHNLSRPSSTASGGIIPVHTEDTVQTVRPVPAEKVLEKTEACSVASVNDSIASPHTMISICASSSPLIVQTSRTMENSASGKGEMVVVESEKTDDTLIEKVPGSPLLTEKKVALGNSTPSQGDNEAFGKSSSFSNLLRRVARAPGSDTTRPVKFEIDLMEMPKQMSGVTNLAAGKTDDTSCVGIVGKEDIKHDLGDSVVDEEIDEHAQGNANEDRTGDNLNGKDKGAENEQEADLHQGGQGEMAVQREKLIKREVEETELLKCTSIKDIKPLDISESSVAPPTSYSCGSIASTSVPISSMTGTSSSLYDASRSPSLPISLAGWPGNLPLGFFSPVAAAAWPAAMPFSGTACADQRNGSAPQVSSFAFQGARHLWKHCSTHVFIAHYIDLQQQMQRHPLWVATYGNTAASLYSTKPYNLNIPVSAPDNILSSGTDGTTTNPSGSIIVGTASRAPNLGSGPMSERPAIATANVQDLKEKIPSTSYDALPKKSRPQQMLHAGQQQHSLSLSLQAGPAFGFPITQEAPAISNLMASVHGVGTAVNATAMGGNSGAESVSTNSTNPGATGLRAGSASGTTNGSVVIEASSQVQYLQAMMQHTGFPFSFPPVHFGPSFNGPPGHISQQATQLFGNPFYGSHLVHPSLHLQQSQADGSATHSSSLKQQQQQPGFWNQSLGPPQEQQQLAHPLSPSQSQVPHTLGAHSHRLSDKEGSIGRESNSFAESKTPALQRSMYTHIAPNIQVSETSSSSVLAASMPALSLGSQDLTLMGVLGPKQNGKPQRQQQTSRQLQPPQQVPIPSQQHHQQLVSAHHHTLSPVLSANIKSLEPQAYSSMFLSSLPKSSVGPGPLGLASVAAIMAPQGHAMLQTTGDHSRNHTQSSHQALSKQPHHRLLVQGQNQRSAVLQRTSSNAADDNRTTMDDASYTGTTRMQDLPEERKTQIKRQTDPDTLSKSEVSRSIQGSIIAGNISGLAVSRGASNSSTSASNIATISNFACHQNGQSTPSVSAPTTSVSQLLKPSLGRTKTSSNAASLPAFSDSSAVGSFTDRTHGAIQSKLAASGFPLSGQTPSNSSSSLRHGHAVQQVSQVKPSQRTSAVSHVQTPPSSPVGSAVPKHQGQVHSRAQQIPMSMAPGQRLLPASSSIPLPSLSPASRHSPAPIPLPPLPPVSKSSMAASAKSTAPTKNSSTHMQKVSGTSPAKRSSSAMLPTSSGIMSPMGQNIPGKIAYPQLHQQIQHGIQQQQQQQQQQQHQHQHQHQHQLYQQHVSQVLQQNQATSTSQQLMAQHYMQQQSNNAIQPSAHLLHRQMLQSQHFEIRQQLALQQQPPYLQQQQHDSNQFQPISPQSQASINPLQQSHGQQSQCSLSISSQSQQQQNATGQQVQKISQSHQGPQFSHPPLSVSFGVVASGSSLTSSEDLTLAADNARTSSTEAEAAGYQAVGTKALKFNGNLVALGPQRNNNVGSSFLQATSANGQQNSILGTSADEACQEPTNGACLTPVSSSSKRLQSPLPGSPHRSQAGIFTGSKHTAGESTGEHVGDTHFSRIEVPISNSTNSNSCINTDLTSVNGKGIPGCSSQYQSVSTPSQPVMTIAASVATAANVTSSSTGVFVAQSSTGLVQP